MDTLIKYIAEMHAWMEANPEQFWVAADTLQFEINKFFYDNGKEATVYEVGMPPPCPEPPCPPKM